MRTQLLLALVVGAALALLAPAAPAQEKTGTVTGLIVYKGKPLSGGSVTFVFGKDAKIKGKINGDGTFKVEGLPVGVAKIAIESKGIPIPRRYASVETSGLTLRVTEGKQRFNIELQ
jgi:hypothetical protein